MFVVVDQERKCTEACVCRRGILFRPATVEEEAEKKTPPPSGPPSPLLDSAEARARRLSASLGLVLGGGGYVFADTYATKGSPSWTLQAHH